jgi:hypothetical protein
MDPFFYFEDDEAEPEEAAQVPETVATSSGDTQDNAGMISQSTVSYGI